MFKSFIATLLILVSLGLSSCSTGVSGLQSYINPYKGYQFLYPNGWVPVEVKNATQGVDVVFRDFIERTENASLIISDIPEEKNLSALGSPSEVGYRLLKVANASVDPNREVDLISADARESKNQTYYILEYEVTLPNHQKRHNLASVATRQGQLFTFNISTPQKRWGKMKDSFETMAKSFSITTYQ